MTVSKLTEKTDISFVTWDNPVPEEGVSKMAKSVKKNVAKSATKSTPVRKTARKTASVSVSSRGRNSNLTGKKLITKPEFRRENPRREGSHGFRSFEIVRKAGPKGITYEGFKNQGGRNNDIRWDLEHGFVQAK